MNKEDISDFIFNLLSTAVIVVFGIIMVSLILTSCSPRVVPRAYYRIESNVRYVEKINLVPVKFNLPHESKSVVTKDTSSFLKISCAFSSAFLKDGLLYHTLETDTTYHPTQDVPVKDIVRDSLRNENKEVIVEVEVEKPLKWWQETLMWIGAISLLILAGRVAWYFLHKF